MKRSLFLLVLICSIGCLRAQDAKSALNSEEVIWYGLDFSLAKFVGTFEVFYGVPSASGADMKNKLVPNWNSLVITELSKYDINAAFRKKNVIFDLKPVSERNKQIDTVACMAYNPGTLSQTDIAGMVQQYTGNEKKEGVGLVFIVETFNRPKAVADIYITFFDIASKKVLISEKVSGNAEGITLRNMWAGAIYDVFKNVRKKKYKEWTRKYA